MQMIVSKLSFVQAVSDLFNRPWTQLQRLFSPHKINDELFVHYQIWNAILKRINIKTK